MGATGMRKTRKPFLCGCLVDAPLEDLSGVLNHPELDMVEWRLDLFAERHSRGKMLEALAILGRPPRRPVMATNRPVGQGGVFADSEALRLETLRRAVEAGAEWVDAEESIPDEDLKWFRERGARILLSHHDFTGTPEADELRALAGRMAGRGARAIKIVTFAHSAEDNLRVLDLIPLGKREFGVDVVAFCMGPSGRWSRPVSLLLGSPWTYVQLPGQSGSAPGQFTPSEIRALWEQMR
jgi:3-dehydroquinate dehydratase type I